MATVIVELKLKIAGLQLTGKKGQAEQNLVLFCLTFNSGGQIKSLHGLAFASMRHDPDEIAEIVPGSSA